MHLVNMDVDVPAQELPFNRFGSTARAQIGPFSPRLNAVGVARGAGRELLLNWLRQVPWDSSESALGQYALGQYTDQRGGYSDNRFGISAALGYGSVSVRQRDVFGALASATGNADTESQLDEIANRFGMLENDTNLRSQRSELLVRQNDIVTRLAKLPAVTTARESLLNRHNELQAGLDRLRTLAGATPAYIQTNGSLGYGSLGYGSLSHDGYSAEQRRYEDRLGLIEADLQRTQVRIEELDRELAGLRGELKLLETSKASVEVNDSYRQQLQTIDERLNRWRQTLKDLRVHRNQTEHEATDARLDRQVGDQLSATKQADPRAALRSLEFQILSARKQLDLLVDRYSMPHDRRDQPPVNLGVSAGGSDCTVHKDAYGQTRISFADSYRHVDSSSLPETLRSMQKDLYEACQQLARHESKAASETLKQQSQQLERCEQELLHSVEKLIEERAALLQKIADEYHLSSEQLSLAFGNWCDCHDHHHLRDWLLTDQQVQLPQVGVDPLVRTRLIDSVAAIEALRKAARLHAEDCRHQLRDAELQRRGLADRRVEPQGRSQAEIQREFDRVTGDLRALDQRESCQRELHEVEQLLVRAQPEMTNHGRFRASVNRHIVGLMGGRDRLSLRNSTSSHSPQPHGNHTQADGYGFAGELGKTTQRRYDPVDGIVYENEFRVEAEVPSELVRVAQRLAIAEAMAAGAQPISLVLVECLDTLPADLQHSALTHLAQVASGRQQVILLTSNQHVMDLVRGLRGWVGYVPRPAGMVEPEINRHLTALANDYEAAKWYQPSVANEPWRTSQPARGEYYLTERSRIDESPSIDSTSAARCRALGVERVGDLLDVDPHWLSDELRLEGVSSATISSWQAEAKLLCGVRQLRPFDARLLVSVGIRTPQQLAEMHPRLLLERVEQFVATERGRRLLRSGSSYELSRITSWIAAAKNGSARFQRSSFDVEAHHRDVDYADVNRHLNDFDPDLEDFQDTSPQRVARDPVSRPTHRDSRLSDRNGSVDGTSRSSRNRARRSSERTARDYPVISREHENRTRTSHSAQRDSMTSASGGARERREFERSRNETIRGDALRLAGTQVDRDNDVRMKFFLELASPVVDAPSIGPRMAARFEKFGVHTVDQLLASHADLLADKINLRRIDGDTIRAWQEQARLVCRIPNLRGHDAQLLVACNLTSPEELAAMEPASVLAQVLVVAESLEGQRILRGSKLPDLAEVNDWISWSRHCRSLSAA